LVFPDGQFKVLAICTCSDTPTETDLHHEADLLRRAATTILSNCFSVACQFLTLACPFIGQWIATNDQPFIGEIV
jgi:hypothetical protein